jgi:hypothetical protein
MSRANDAWANGASLGPMRPVRRRGVALVSLAIVLTAAVVIGAGPTLQAIRARPALAAIDRNLRSIHVAKPGVDVGGPIDVDAVLTPSLAYRLLRGGRPDELMVSGAVYTAAGESSRWLTGPRSPWDPPTHPPVVQRLGLWWRDLGLVRVVGTDASGWHLQGSSGGIPVDLWVATDGCPVRATATFPARFMAGPDHPFDVDYTYARCNQVGAIAAPAAALLRGPARRGLTGGVGQRIALDGSTVTVTATQLTAQPPAPSLPPPAAGKQYLVVDVRFENGTKAALPYSLRANGPGLANSELSGVGPLAGRGALPAAQAAAGRFAVQVPSTGAGFTLVGAVDVDDFSVQLTPTDALSITAVIGQPVRLHTALVTVQSVNLDAPNSPQTGDYTRPGDRIVTANVSLQLDAPAEWHFEIAAGGGTYPNMNFWPADGPREVHQLRFAVPRTASGLTLVARIGNDTLSLALGG